MTAIILDVLSLFTLVSDGVKIRSVHSALVLGVVVSSGLDSPVLNRYCTCNVDMKQQTPKMIG